MQAGKYLNKLFIPGLVCLLTISSLSLTTTSLAADKPDQKAETASPLQGDNKTLSGKVIETMDARHYTYVLLKKDDTETWLAVPKMKVTVGDELEFWKGIEMNKFNSTQLNRTFDTIFFSSGLVSGAGPTDEDIVSMAHGGRPPEQIASDNKETAIKQEATEPQHTPDKNRQQDAEIIQNAHGGQTLASLESGKAPALNTLAEPIAKAAGTNGYTISEIYEKQKELEGKEVAVRGRAVTIAAGVLKMNWIHLQDGSGSVSSGTHDITVTSSDDPPKVGDIITMRGTVNLNKDFGAGYKYALILMEGKME